MSAVVAINLSIHKGTDFETEFDLAQDNGSPLNLTGYSASAKIRKHPTAKKYNNFVVTFVDREQGKLKISMGSSVTPNLNPGRNCYDVLLTDRVGKIIKVVEGNVLVNNSTTLGGTESQNIEGIGNIDVSNVRDGYVLMYNESMQKYIFVDPDVILSKSVTSDNTLPQEFINKLGVDLDNLIDTDGGNFTSPPGGITEEDLNDIGNIDTTNISDGYVLMYDQPQQKYVFVDPDEILSKSVTTDNELPQEFIDKLEQDLDGLIDTDGGDFTP